MRLDAHQDIHQVVIRVDVVELAGGDHCLQDREVLTGFIVANEEEVVAAEGLDSSTICDNIHS